MPMWRCPHCGTPQAEAARCWVCRRSSTACGTCRHFRRSVAGGLGYCGLDRRRAALRGDEIMGCWEAGSEPALIEATPTRPTAALLPRTERALDFVPVTTEAAVDPRRSRPSRRSRLPAPAPGTSEAIPPPTPDGRWSLWADLDG